MGDDKIKKVLIAGGAGFLGSRLANKLILLGRQAIVLDNLSTGRKENLNSRVKFYLADIANSGMVENIFKKEKPDAVINLAAKVYWDEKEKNSGADISTGVLGTINLLENCVRRGVKKFIFASTVSVYGRLESLAGALETEIIDFKNLPVSIFSYAAAKIAAEQYIYYFSKKYGLAYAILRYAHVYGPDQFRQRDVISIFIEKIANNKPLLIAGEGRQFRDFVFIDDAVSAAILAINKKAKGIYNIGGGRPIAINDLVGAFKKIFKNNIIAENVKAAEKSDGRCMNILKAKRELGWSPKTSLEQGLKKTIEDYLKNFYKK